MLLKEAGKPLTLEEVPIPKPKEDEVLLKVLTCGVCRTDLHIVDGELPHPHLPLILGHQIVGQVVEVGAKVTSVRLHERVGVAWLGGSCQKCEYCKAGQENLCDEATYTGYQRNGGFAEYCTAKAHFVFSIPPGFQDVAAAPLLCAGLIGYRAFRMTGFAKKIAFYGFGASAHILTQLVVHKGGEVYAFTKPGDIEHQEFAKQIGAVWAGNVGEEPPFPLDAALIFAPAGELVPVALKAVKKGGVVVCAGIHMSDIPSFPYKLLWQERILRSVANLTRKDGEEFLALAPKIPIRTHVTVYPLEKANQALDDLRKGRFSGSAVLKITSDS